MYEYRQAVASTASRAGERSYEPSSITALALPYLGRYRWASACKGGLPISPGQLSDTTKPKTNLNTASLKKKKATSPFRISLSEFLARPHQKSPPLCFPRPDRGPGLSSSSSSRDQGSTQSFPPCACFNFLPGPAGLAAASRPGMAHQLREAPSMS